MVMGDARHGLQAAAFFWDSATGAEVDRAHEHHSDRNIGGSCRAALLAAPPPRRARAVSESECG